MTLTAIGPREASIFTALADAFVAPEPALPAVRDTDALRTFDVWLARSPRLNRVGLRVLLHVAELAPLLFGGGGRLRRLDPERRRRWLGRVEHLPWRVVRELTRALKTLILLCYYGDPVVMVRLGYDAEANVRRGRELRQAEGRP
ncbi:MAG TPA: hypothetical protein VII01_05960 [Solirubrobacteraceae bacterium]